MQAIHLGMTLYAAHCFLVQMVRPLKLLQHGIGNMEDILKEEGLMPDVVEKAPFYIAVIHYANDTLVTFGNKIPKNLTDNEPVSVKWMPDCHKYYTLIMTDADAFPENPLKERQLWVVGNILSMSLETGETLTAYAGPDPAKGSGPHKIVFVIYEQKKKVVFKEPKITMPYDVNRDNFSTVNFTKKYNFEDDPNAGNFFTAEWGV